MAELNDAAPVVDDDDDVIYDDDNDQYCSVGPR